MATATFPKQTTHRRGWLIAGVAVIIVAISAALLLTRVSGSSAPALNTTVVQRSSLVATVDGNGSIAAAQSLDMVFATSGTVSAVLVEEGATVFKGQPLAQIDDRNLQLQVENAQAGLASAQARMEQAQQGNATPQDIAASQATVANSSAQLQKARTGNTTQADIASAQAQLRSAQAQLDALQNPSPDKVSSADSTLKQAEITLQQTRDSASASKTRAEQDMYRSVDALTQAQSSYALALANWQRVQDRGTDPINPQTDAETGKTKKLNDAQQQQYYDQFIQAQAALKSAEAAVEQNKVAFENARQQEITQIQNGEVQIANAQQQLQALMSPSPTDLTQAQASVDQARANLQKLQQGGTAADVEAARANVWQSQANLEKLTAPATSTNLSIQQASIAQAEQSVKQAQLNLEQATLLAPFDGVVTTVNIVPGSTAGSAGAAAMTLVDRSTLHVDLKLSENDVAKVELGQPVELTIDALSGWAAQGTVSYIAPTADDANGVVTYRVRVRFPDSDARVKVGMTANVAVTTATKDGVLVVPNTALLPRGAGRVVQVPDGDGVREVEVQTGITDGTSAEITGGLNEGATIVATPNTQQESGGGLLQLP